MLIHTFSNQDQLYRYSKDCILTFSGKRNVLSTSALSGGYHENLNCVFNYDEKGEIDNQCEMKESTYEEHLFQIAKDKLNLDPVFCTGLSTAADMENLAIETEEIVLIDGTRLTVSAVVTGGIDKNGARVGDPACWQEIDGTYHPIIPGTINIILHLDAALTEGAMARALVTCTEAKTAAVGELLCPSLYSSGIATGSGTDGVIIITNPSSQIHLTSAGKDSKLGEMIGKSVMKAVKKTIALQTDVSEKTQHHVLRRLERFGLTEDFFYQVYREESYQKPWLCREELILQYTPLFTDGFWTGKASCIAHLFDQFSWNMLSEKDLLSMIPLLFSEQKEKLQKEDFSIQSWLKAFSFELLHQNKTLFA